MALTKTSLAVALTPTQTRMTVTSATGATVGGVAIINDEYAFISAISGVSIDLTRRGSFGTLVKSHNILAPLTFGLTSDIPDLAPGQTVPKPATDYWDQRTVHLDNGFDPGVAGNQILTRDTEVLITKATALANAMTAPSQALDGLMVRFVSDTAFAHVITAVGLGITSATFAATRGCSVTFRVQSGRYACAASSGVTVVFT